MTSGDDFVVIGAGLPRTGTNSLQVALEQLLGPTYHMQTVLRSRGTAEVDFWNKALTRQVNEEVIKVTHYYSQFDGQVIHFRIGVISSPSAISELGWIFPYLSTGKTWWKCIPRPRWSCRFDPPSRGTSHSRRPFSSSWTWRRINFQCLGLASCLEWVPGWM